MSLSTPIAFIIFNRPDLTQIVFDAIRQAQPKQLFVIADGARFSEESEKCQRAKDIIKQVDWDCQVLINYADHNLGCRQRVSSGISWVFEQVEEAIILEDDCLPSPSFFHFCETLLERYRDDERIMHIAGTNHQDGQSRTEYSYFFSKIPHIWGWATWRRAWNHYDLDMRSWKDFKNSGMIEFVSDDNYENKYWSKIFDKMISEDSIDTWDYMWVYACLTQSGLAILPNSDLVSNIGFREDATHTKNISSLSSLPTKDIWDINHPPFIVRNKIADMYIFNFEYGGMHMRQQDTFQYKIKQKLSTLKQLLKKDLRK